MQGKWQKHDKQSPAIQNLLDSLSTQQAEILESDASVLQIIAAAGSGKTRTIIALIQYLLLTKSERPGRILMLSFSRKAVAELKERLPASFCEQVRIHTFHGFCYQMIRGIERHSRKPICIFEESHRKHFLREFFQKHEEQVGGIPFGLLLEDLESDAPAFPKLYAELKRSIEQYKKERNLWEYEDLIQAFLEGLRAENPYFVSIRNELDCIIVDEFQDTDPAQLEFLQLMQPRRLVIVGDDYQAIYAFRGATVRPFLDFPKIFPKTKQAFLETNFRSRPEIVSLGNHVIRHSSHQLSKRVRAHRKPSGKSLFSITIEGGEERALAENLGQLDVDWKILVRSNYRGEVWKAAGISEDRILTIHKSKGLEFSWVFLDLLGGWSASVPKARKGLVDEEVRIHYVALTRAKDKFVVLHLPEYSATAKEGIYFNKFYKKRCKEIFAEDLLSLGDRRNKENILRASLDFAA